MDSVSSQLALQIEALPGSKEGVRIVKLNGPFVISNFFEFQHLAREDKSPVLIVDLGGVPYMDSAALGALLGVHVSSVRKQSKYALINVAPRIENMFTLSGVRDTLVVFPTLADAEAALL
jgi:anti-sigma B factor antagonist